MVENSRFGRERTLLKLGIMTLLCPVLFDRTTSIKFSFMMISLLQFVRVHNTLGSWRLLSDCGVRSRKMQDGPIKYLPHVQEKCLDFYCNVRLKSAASSHRQWLRGGCYGDDPDPDDDPEYAEARRTAEKNAEEMIQEQKRQKAQPPRYEPPPDDEEDPYREKVCEPLCVLPHPH